MPLNLASPGIIVKEVDLTSGRATPSSNKVGAIVAPFAKGPSDVPILVENENDLLKTFGEPYAVDKHYEDWLVASSYLAYGGSLRVVRADDPDLATSFVGSGTSIKIKSLDHYNQLGYDENTIPNVVVSARNPGSWANGIKVAIIDGKADQILTGISTTNILVGYGITQAITSVLPGIGATSNLNGYLKGVVTGIGQSTIDVKVVSYVSNTNIESSVDYQPSGIYAFGTSAVNVHLNTTGIQIGTSITLTSKLDWFDQQTIAITSTTSILWNSVAPRPSTTSYAAARNSKNDEIHVVVIDSLGTQTGNSGTILEKHLGLSKAKDAEFSTGNPSYWRKYLANNSSYIFGGGAPSGIVTTGFTTSFTLVSNNSWDQAAEGIVFSATGANTNTLSGGKDYHGLTSIASTGGLTASLATLSSGYDLFENTDNYKVDFLLMGSAAYDISTAQALANKIISIAELRKDALAFISPYRGSALTDTSIQTNVNVNSSSTITDNLISFYAPITSSSYAVFDSGYKYMYDRFANTFRYVPLNGDMAGLCARNDINNFPWYSPAGTSRGAILNAVKLAYNPSKSQRDRLYSNRINPVIFSPGSGIILFGDKTGLSRASAFDRINVRRLFVYLEDAISKAAKDALFEFNDEITRTNFVNTIEPFLRDVQAKRGIYDYVVICDETNNTAAVIDNNQFIADIYIKPARSINFIGLTFIATKTGVDFEEVIGNF
jgi:Phage tail sheath protein subtilisin-like domain/Phage tail sheath C-terminal domain